VSKQIGGGGIMNPSQRAVPSGADHENWAGSFKERASQNEDFGKIALTSSLCRVKLIF
jgi:hypothetical protein